MRRAARTDDNQTAIVEALRSIGATVQILSGVGHGCPDLLVGIFKRNYLMEVKDGDKSPSRQSLTPEEHIWHNEWKGQVCIVRNPTEAIESLNPRK